MARRSRHAACAGHFTEVPNEPHLHTQSRAIHAHSGSSDGRLASWLLHTASNTRTHSAPPRGYNFLDHFATQRSKFPARLQPLHGASTSACALLRCGPALQALASQHARSLGTRAHEQAPPRLRPCVTWQGSKETGGHPEKYSSQQLRRLCPGDVRASGGSVLLVPVITLCTGDLEECVRGVRETGELQLSSRATRSGRGA